MEKKHGNTGNAYAAHGDSAKESFLHIRLDSATKSKFVRSANAEKMKLSAWVIKHLSAAAGE